MNIKINSYIQGDPLSDDNLNDTLGLVEEFNKKGIKTYLLTSYSSNDINCSFAALREDYGLDYNQQIEDNHTKRQQIAALCKIMYKDKEG